MFKTIFKSAYDAVASTTTLKPEEFFKGSDSNGDKKIIPDEFESYMERLPRIIQENRSNRVK
jgi:hypothetical protein